MITGKKILFGIGVDVGAELIVILSVVAILKGVDGTNTI